MMRDRATWTTDVLVHSCTMMRTSKSVKSVGDDERSGASHSSAQRAHGRATRARDDFEYRYYDIQNDPIARAAFDAADLSVTPIRRSKRVETGRVAAIVTDSRAFCRPHDDDDMRANKRCENPHASIARIVASTRDVDIRRWMASARVRVRVIPPPRELAALERIPTRVPDRFFVRRRVRNRVRPRARRVETYGRSEAWACSARARPWKRHTSSRRTTRTHGCASRLTSSRLVTGPLTRVSQRRVGVHIRCSRWARVVRTNRASYGLTALVEPRVRRGSFVPAASPRDND